MQHGVPRGRGLSLWWMPPRAVAERLQGLIDALAGRLGTPSFAPHVTVESGLSAAPEELAAQLGATLQARLAPELRPTGLTSGAAWNRTLVLELEPDAAVREARTAVCTALGRTVMPGSFHPHLSLVYGPLAEPVRARLVEGLKLQVEPFHPVALALVDTSGPVTDWWEVQRWTVAAAG